MVALQLDGKVAVVTGGGRGLGAAAAWALAEAGADVALLARSEDQIIATAREIEDATGRKILSCACDVTDENSVEEAASLVIATYGRIDVLVNNAGIAPVAPLLDLELLELRRVLDVNVVGSFLCARAFGAHMVAQRKGTVINMASVAGLGGEAELTAYCASKHAVVGLTKALALEWARHNVTVNAIAPGYFRTDLNKHALDDVKIGPKIVGHIPLRRVGQPEELGPLIVYLASDAAAYMTGTVVVLDGGQLAR
ncbi:MAG: 2-deoxy-D-gluconate 3-dehydrogenase [Myxococcales bacterium]|nr:2-deoxy-D-gluconate 3-dehydrogenase [Myxococcales bacterium]